MKQCIGVRLVDATHIDVALHPLPAAEHYAKLCNEVMIQAFLQ